MLIPTLRLAFIDNPDGRRTDVVGIFPTVPPSAGWWASCWPSSTTSGRSASVISGCPSWTSEPRTGPRTQCCSPRGQHDQTARVTLLHHLAMTLRATLGHENGRPSMESTADEEIPPSAAASEQQAIHRALDGT